MESELIIEKRCEKIIQKAISFGASDVQILPSETHYSVFFRKFGQLSLQIEIPLDVGARIVSYYKFLSELDISEKRKPQSGAFHYAFEELQFSMRTSTLPSHHGSESLVIRLLLQHHTLPLQTLFLNPETASKLQKIVQGHQGLLLFSGATGSGKTTTLYSLLRYCLQDLKKHVISLEDPVESEQQHMLQIQVNEKAGITYASGLKAILRHTPDVIMIGEIRDRETAEIAVEASLTGHLVVSTIHAKDSVNSIFRLLDLGVPLANLRQALVGVAAQTLIKLPFEEDRKAIVELLTDDLLQRAFDEISNRQNYTLPVNETIAAQLHRYRGEFYRDPTPI